MLVRAYFRPYSPTPPFSCPVLPFYVDVVLWDSHPLALGATPQQVWIDGIAQLEVPHLLFKPAAFQKVPKVPDFDKEMKQTLEYDGLPPLAAAPASSRTVVFTNVSSVFLRDAESASINEAFTLASSGLAAAFVVRDGVPICYGPPTTTCATALQDLGADAQYVDLEGGAVSPGLTSAGTLLGLAEIDQETWTHDGPVFDALTQGVPGIVGGSGALIRAADGLMFGTRDALYVPHPYRRPRES